MRSILKHPSAWIPLALSGAIIAMEVYFLSVAGPPVRQPDEGVGAHLFQLWLVLEFFMIGFFALKWLPQNPKPAFIVLTFQIFAVLVACAPVFYFRL